MICLGVRLAGLEQRYDSLLSQWSCSNPYNWCQCDPSLSRVISATVSGIGDCRPQAEGTYCQEWNSTRLVYGMLGMDTTPEAPWSGGCWARYYRFHDIWYNSHWGRLTVRYNSGEGSFQAYLEYLGGTWPIASGWPPHFGLFGAAALTQSEAKGPCDPTGPYTLDSFWGIDEMWEDVAVSIAASNDLSDILCVPVEFLCPPLHDCVEDVISVIAARIATVVAGPTYTGAYVYNDEDFHGCVEDVCDNIAEISSQLACTSGFVPGFTWD